MSSFPQLPLVYRMVNAPANILAISVENFEPLSNAVKAGAAQVVLPPRRLR